MPIVSASKSLGRFIGAVAAVLTVAGVCLLAIGCDRAAASRGPKVVVTIPPLAGLVQPLLPPGDVPRTLVTGAQSEHGYQLTAGDAADLAGADVVVYVGLGLEPQVEQFLAAHPNPKRQVVCFADVVGLHLPAGAPPHELHHADDHDDDDAGPLNPHLWLDPDLVTQLVPALSKAVQTAVGPEGADAVAARAGKLQSDLAGFDADSKATLAPLAGRAIVTHHAAWGRFARHYGLKVAAVLRPIETAEPTPGDVEAAVKAIREQGVTAIFVEPQFSRAAADRIAAATGVRVGTLDPLGNGDWFAMMRSNVDTLAKTLGH